MLKFIFVSEGLRFFNRREFPITETEDKLMTIAAIIGERRSPKTGYNTPAAIGTPMEL